MSTLIRCCYCGDPYVPPPPPSVSSASISASISASSSSMSVIDDQCLTCCPAYPRRYDITIDHNDRLIFGSCVFPTAPQHCDGAAFGTFRVEYTAVTLAGDCALIYESTEERLELTGACLFNAGPQKFLRLVINCREDGMVAFTVEARMANLGIGVGNAVWFIDYSAIDCLGSHVLPQTNLADAGGIYNSNCASLGGAYRADNITITPV